MTIVLTVLRETMMVLVTRRGTWGNCISCSIICVRMQLLAIIIVSSDPVKSHRDDGAQFDSFATKVSSFRRILFSDSD